MNLYIREATSKLEFFDVKKILKKINFVKCNYIKKGIKKIVKLFINLKYIFLYYFGKNVEKHQKNFTECLIPLKEKNSNRLINIWKKNITGILNKNKYDNIIISKKIKNIEIFKNFLYKNDEVEGKKLLKIMIEDVIKYICKTKNESIESKTIYILANHFSKENLEFIENISFKVKSVNIVTQNLKKYLIFADKIYSKNNIMLSVSNNKRKTLSKANMIVNLDFSEDIIVKYNINRSSIFINLFNEKINNIKGFSGIFINGLSIKENKKFELIGISKYKLYNCTNYYESLICEFSNLKEINKKIKQDNIEINYLIGKSGKIDINEYSKIA